MRLDIDPVTANDYGWEFFSPKKTISKSPTNKFVTVFIGLLWKYLVVFKSLSRSLHKLALEVSVRFLWKSPKEVSKDLSKCPSELCWISQKVFKMLKVVRQCSYSKSLNIYFKDIFLCYWNFQIFQFVRSGNLLRNSTKKIYKIHTKLARKAPEFFSARNMLW